jgi:hypothetical protein
MRKLLLAFFVLYSSFLILFLALYLVELEGVGLFSG